MQQIEKDIQFVKTVLPNNYEVKESKKAGSIHCRSAKGIESDGDWRKAFSILKDHFGERFQEVYHNTCYNHVDFTIYLRQSNNAQEVQASVARKAK